jgi:hypothetical protein
MKLKMEFSCSTSKCNFFPKGYHLLIDIHPVPLLPVHHGPEDAIDD